MPYVDLTLEQKAAYFAALEAYGKNGREEIQRLYARQQEINNAVISNEDKQTLAQIIGGGFATVLDGMGAQLPQPDDFVTPEPEEE